MSYYAKDDTVYREGWSWIDRKVARCESAAWAKRIAFALNALGDEVIVAHDLVDEAINTNKVEE